MRYGESQIRRESERERVTEGDSHRGRQSDTERVRDGESQRRRESERERVTEGESHRGRESHRERVTERRVTEGESQRGGESERGRVREGSPGKLLSNAAYRVDGHNVDLNYSDIVTVVARRVSCLRLKVSRVFFCSVSASCSANQIEFKTMSTKNRLQVLVSALE